MTLAEAHDFTFNELGFCGCGDPEEALSFLHSYLKITHDLFVGDKSDTERAELFKKRSVLVCQDTNIGASFFIQYMIDNSGLTEHGGSIISCWLSHLGEEYLEAIDGYGVNTIVNYSPGLKR